MGVGGPPVFPTMEMYRESVCLVPTCLADDTDSCTATHATFSGVVSKSASVGRNAFRKSSTLNHRKCRHLESLDLT